LLRSRGTSGLFRGGQGLGYVGNPLEGGSIFSLEKFVTAFQADVFATLACARDTKFRGPPEKQKTLSFYSNSLAALKALSAVTPSPLVHPCRDPLNAISARHAVDCTGSLDMLQLKAIKLPMGW
jgi:hypothetical protein